MALHAGLAPSSHADWPACTRREDLQRNVVLIRELNLNIGKVVELYRELSVRCGHSRWPN